MEVGFIGLGTMGAPMVENLLRAGFSVTSSRHRKPPPQKLLELGLKTVEGHDAVARVADVIITMVPDTADVADVLFGEAGVASASLAGKLVIDMSSISPAETVRFAERLRQSGCRYLDAPVSGGEVGARQATLTIFVGGDEADLAIARPLFEAMGKNVTLMGANGAGQTTKVANQIIVAVTIQAVAEGLVFASKAGVDPALVIKALGGGLAGSRILELHGHRMVDRAFDPGFRIQLHRKDLSLAMDNAREIDIALPATALAQTSFNACCALGHGQKDHSALVCSIELLSGHDLSKLTTETIPG